MKNFLKTVIGAIIAVLIVYGGLLLLGFFMNVLSFSFEEAVLTIFLAPFALAILFFLLSSLLALISDAALKSSDLPSFLMNLSINVVVAIIGLAIIIGGLYFVAQIAVCIGILVLGLGFAAGLLGIGGVRNSDIEKEIDELKREQSYIKKSNNILDDGSRLSKSELRHNQRLYDKLGEKIRDKERELED